MNKIYPILVVDDHADSLFATRETLSRLGYTVDTAVSGKEAFEKVSSAEKEYAVILLDYLMPEELGADTAKRIREINSEVSVLIYSCDQSREAPIGSLRAGAIDFIDKSEDPAYLEERVAQAYQKFIEEGQTLKRYKVVSDPAKAIARIGLIGQSVKMLEVVDSVERFRDTRENILLRGETGVGKELVAKALLNGSKEKFLTVNCASYAKSELLESELFGHERGSFSGAYERKIGIFERVRGGTVFLDEVHHLGINAQAQLLRAVREKKIRRVGGGEEFPVEFRLIAAVNPKIDRMVEEKAFEADLYFRLSVLIIEIPPLRERPEDIEPLVCHFVDRYNQKNGTKKKFLTSTVRKMEQHNWPGNIGELESLITRILVKSPRDTIESKQLRDALLTSDIDLLIPSGDSFVALESRHDREKKSFISSALRAARSVQQAADRMGLPRTTLQSLMVRLGIRA